MEFEIHLSIFFMLGKYSQVDFSLFITFAYLQGQRCKVMLSVCLFVYHNWHKMLFEDMMSWCQRIIISSSNPQWRWRESQRIQFQSKLLTSLLDEGSKKKHGGFCEYLITERNRLGHPFLPHVWAAFKQCSHQRLGMRFDVSFTVYGNFWWIINLDKLKSTHKVCSENFI